MTKLVVYNDQTESLQSIDQLFAFPGIRLEKRKPEEVTSKLHF